MISAVVLFLIAAFCIYQAIAAGEIEAWWSYWRTDGIVALACVIGACWLIRPMRTQAG